MTDQQPAITFVVYPPPANGLPYLAVAISPDGAASVAKPFATHAEAEAYKNGHALWTYEKIYKDVHADR